jgi:hypothetical protein
METTHQPLQLHKWSVVQWKVMDIPAIPQMMCGTVKGHGHTCTSTNEVWYSERSWTYLHLHKWSVWYSEKSWTYLHFHKWSVVQWKVMDIPALTQMKCGTAKGHGHTCTSKNEVWYSERSWTYLHLHKWSVVQWKVMDILALTQMKCGTAKGHGHTYNYTNEVWYSERSWAYLHVLCVCVLFDETFEYGDGVKCWGYVGTNVGPLCVAFCNFIQCHIFVKFSDC